MADRTIPRKVIAEDNRLEKATERATEDLARLRWHWTLDETNPDRVSLRAYARAVARAYSTVHRWANGYAQWIAGDRRSTITDALALVTVGADKAAAFEAVADARGTTVENVRRHHQEAVATVRAVAEERAERSGTTVGEELAQAAEDSAMAWRSAKRRREQRRDDHTVECLQVEGMLCHALGSMRRALAVLRAVEFPDDDVEYLADLIAKTSAFLKLLDVALTGTTDVDWDREMQKLEASQ